MGYMKEKYTKQYFLNQDDNGNKTKYGATGLDAFQIGGIRGADYKILSKLKLKDKYILTIGFGRGEDIKCCIGNKCKFIEGIDFSKYACNIAIDFLNNFNINTSKYLILCMDILDYLNSPTYKEHRKGLFDIVLMFDVIEHIPRNEVKLIFEKLKHFCKDNYIICVNTPFYKQDNDVIKDGYVKSKSKDTSDLYPETQGMHCNRYSKKSFYRFMKSFNYEIVFNDNLKIWRYKGDNNNNEI
jgi:2-polyprenyl-3-methyl-5-hydroxy-6-metoxy-1,4-benzoquinol methylase